MLYSLTSDWLECHSYEEESDEKCNFSIRKVKLSWSSKKKQPGQNVTMNLKASPGSFCGYSVVDRSVTYARPDLQLTETTIYDWLLQFHISSDQYPRQVTPDWEYCSKSMCLELLDPHFKFCMHGSMRWSILILCSLAEGSVDDLDSGALIDDLDSDTMIDDLRRRKRSFIYQRPSVNSKDAMEAFDVCISK